MHYSQEIKETMLAKLARPGACLQDLAHQHNISLSTVRRWQRAASPHVLDGTTTTGTDAITTISVDASDPRKKQKDHVLNRFIQQPITMSALAREVGISRTTLRRWVRAAGIPTDSGTGGALIHQQRLRRTPLRNITRG